MTYPGGVDPNFITITHAPTEGQERRRQFIRQRVMANYHKQKRRHFKRGADGPKSSIEWHSTRKSTPGTSSSSTVDSTASIAQIRASSSSIKRPLESAYLLQRKTWGDAGHQQTSEMIIKFLCGQIRKGVRDLPSVVFVHYQVRQTADKASNPLIACQALLRDYSPTDLHSTSLWEGVYTAQESIYITCASYNKWQLLSAAQAITLFVLLRLSHGTNHAAFPDADIALLYSLRKTFKLLQDRYINRLELSNSSTMVEKWEDWIFRESTIRTSSIYFLLTLTVSMDFGLACDRPSDWRLEEIPLPAAKAVWEARDETAWERAIISNETGTPVLTFGDLIHMHESPLRSRIESWQEDTDELGLLVTIASSLAARRDRP